jgi:uncharacterized protein YbcI
MQKLINVLALTSFAVSAGVVAGGTYVYLEKDNLVESVKENITKEIQGIVGDALLPFHSNIWLTSKYLTFLYNVQSVPSVEQYG